MIPDNIPNHELIGRKCWTLEELRNTDGYSIPSGIMCIIKDVNENRNFAIQSVGCPTCGKAVYLTNVPASKLDMCQTWEETTDRVYRFTQDQTMQLLAASYMSGYWDHEHCRKPRFDFGIPSNPRLTIEQLKQTIHPVWCATETFDGRPGFWCLCDKGIITAPSGEQFKCEDIPNWPLHFYPCSPDDTIAEKWQVRAGDV